MSDITLLACRYIESGHCIPPVRFEELLRQKLPEELRTEIDRIPDHRKLDEVFLRILQQGAGEQALIL